MPKETYELLCRLVTCFLTASFKALNECRNASVQISQRNIAERPNIRVLRRLSSRPDAVEIHLAPEFFNNLSCAHIFYAQKQLCEHCVQQRRKLFDYELCRLKKVI